MRMCCKNVVRGYTGVDPQTTDHQLLSNNLYHSHYYYGYHIIMVVTVVMLTLFQF